MRRDRTLLTILTGCAYIGAAVLLGWMEVPGSLERQLPGWGDEAWAWLMLTGSALAIVGVAWPRVRDTPHGPRLRTTPILVEQVGISLWGAACATHALTVVANVGQLNAFAVVDLAFVAIAVGQWFRLRGRVQAGSRRG